MQEPQADDSLDPQTPTMIFDFITPIPKGLFRLLLHQLVYNLALLKDSDVGETKIDPHDQKAA